MPKRIDGSSINEWNNTEYNTNHGRVRKARGKASGYKCFFCMTKQARDWAWIHHTDPTKTISYVPACRLCHQEYDRPMWLKEERAAKAETSQSKGWTEERRKAASLLAKARWAEPGAREAQSEKCKRDKPWQGRRPTRWKG